MGVGHELFGKDVNIVDSSDSGYDSALYWPVPRHYKLSQELHSGGAIDISDSSIENAPVHAAEGGTVSNVYHCTRNHEGEYGDCDSLIPRIGGRLPAAAGSFVQNVRRK